MQHRPATLVTGEQRPCLSSSGFTKERLDVAAGLVSGQTKLGQTLAIEKATFYHDRMIIHICPDCGASIELGAYSPGTELGQRKWTDRCSNEECGWENSGMDIH
jgi:hypothetical protein